MQTVFKQILMIISFIFVLSLVGCKSKATNNDFSIKSPKNYYTKQDFKSIIIWESTYQDVYDIASSQVMFVTSYGGYCEYPMSDGGCIRIKFYGPDLIVGMIEELKTGDGTMS